MRRTRRRRTGQWLVPTAKPWGSSLALAHQNPYISLVVPSLAINPADDEGFLEIPLTINDQQNLLYAGVAGAVLPPFNAQNAADEGGFGYALKRVVGNLIVMCAPTDSTNDLTPSVVVVGAGLMVRRVSPDSPDTSVAFTADPLGGGGINPLALENATDPWIWRRTWLMSPGNAGGPNQPSSPSADDEASPFSGVFQPSNTVFTGPNHTASIDAKTRRTVKAEERLFLNLGIRAWGLNPITTEPAIRIAFGLYFDYRLFGRTFTSKGNRRNASR